MFLLKSVMFLTLTRATHLGGNVHTLGGSSGSGHQVSSSSGGASISFPNGPPQQGLSITPHYGSGGFSGCGSGHHGPSRRAIESPHQAALLRIFKGNSPLSTVLHVQLDGTDQREAMASIPQEDKDRMGDGCACHGFDFAMLFDRMILAHVKEASFESELTWKGKNDQDYIHVVVNSNGQIVSTTVSLCPDNVNMSMPTVVMYDVSAVQPDWFYTTMRGSMVGNFGMYRSTGVPARAVPSGGLRIVREHDQSEITDAFIPTGQRSGGYTLGGGGMNALTNALADRSVDDGAQQSASPERLAKEEELAKLKARLSRPPVSMTPEQIATDPRISKMQSAIDALKQQGL